MSTAERLEQLRDLPRVTAADRERYKQWEQEARAELVRAEPISPRLERAYLQAAMLRKSWLVLHRPGEGDVPITRDAWRNYWRSLPDYDGPPMRAPSGTDYHRVFRADGSSRVSIPLRVEGEVAAAGVPLAMLFGEIEEYHEPSSRELRERFVINKYKAIFGAPSAGGRGWCPKLAEAV